MLVLISAFNLTPELHLQVVWQVSQSQAACLQLKVDLFGAAPGCSKQTESWKSETDDRCTDGHDDAILFRFISA